MFTDLLSKLYDVLFEGSELIVDRHAEKIRKRTFDDQEFLPIPSKKVLKHPYSKRVGFTADMINFIKDGGRLHHRYQ